MYMSNHSKTKIIAGLFYVFIAFLLFAQEPKKPFLKLISHKTIEKQKWNRVREIYSENGKFRGVIVFGSGGDYIPVDKFTLKDSSGNIIWESDSIIATRFLIANDGSVIGIAPVSGPVGPMVIYFYDPKGYLVERTEELHPFSKFSLSPDGNYFLIYTVRDELLVFNLEGVFIQNYGLCKYFTASPRRRTVVVNICNELRFYRNDKLMWKKDIKGMGYHDFLISKTMAISSSDQYLAVVSRQKLYFFETDTPSKLWEIDAEKNAYFTSVDLSSQADKIILALSFYSVDIPGRTEYGYIYVFNRNGEKLATQKIDYIEPDKYLSLPRVDISEDGKFITVNTDFDIYKFELE